MSSNSFAIAKSAAAKLKMKMKMLPAGFSVALCNTAIQSCDRHSNRNVLLLRIADFVFDSERLLRFRQVSILRLVRGLYIAMVQYSSLCVSAVVKTLGGDDIEDGVPDREQVDCEREKVEERELRERVTRGDNKRTLKHVTSWMACGWSEMRTEKTLSHNAV